MSEATAISPGAGAYRCSPGIWLPEQMSARKEITHAVHAGGCTIYCQLWHLGRSGQADTLAMFGRTLKAPSAIRIQSEFAHFQVPEELTESDIWEMITNYARAARNAIEGAGFDGVEVHGANGYLPDQFLRDVFNKRSDDWGGSIENRSRFHVEVTKAVVNAIGRQRTDMRLSPYSEFLSMGMKNAIPQFSHVVRELKKMGLSYLHLVEWRITGQRAQRHRCPTGQYQLRLGPILAPSFLLAPSLGRRAREAVERMYKDVRVMIAFGRHFIANPDLVYRLKAGLSLSNYDRSTFYLPLSEKGYVDYPVSQEGA